MTPRAHRAPRGLTLVELLVALGVSTIVVAAAATLLQAQQRAHVAGSGQRALQETARVAVEELVRNLREAGYGVDPAMTLDFGPQDNAPRKSLYSAGKGFISSYRCANPVRCRDSTAGSDEIVFYSRDPLFSRPVVGVTASTVTLRGDLKENLLPGQILQLMCLLDQRTVAYVTVNRTAVAPAVANPLNNVVVSLANGQVGGALALPAFPFENSELASPCFAGGLGAVVATKIDRYRYYVETYDDTGAIVAAETPGSRPYLMLDQGLSDDNGNRRLSPVAPDVEDLQLAYLYPPLVAGAGSRTVGVALGTNIADEGSGVSLTQPPPAIGDEPDAPSRRTGNPANILGVRIGVVVRTPEPDLQKTGVQDATLPAVGNRNGLVGLTTFQRARFETTVMLKNIQGRGVLYPVVDATGGTAGALLGGG